MATRHSHPGPAETHSRERFLQAALTILVQEGVAGLTVRNLADAAGSSTVGVYTRFGGRSGVLDALYERTFELLHQEFVRLPERTGRTAGDILAFARAYRRFALESPARYGFMFERPVPGFDPDPNLRAHAQRHTFDLLVDRIRAAAPPDMAARVAAYLVWTTMHGLVSVELTNRQRTSPPGWFLDPGDDSYSRVFTEGLTAVMRGLGVLA
ncbi:MAG TPA: TetR/AcrR family transcriptional regulator [Amycolatopsis sp.]|uniref:TetR/AcrR family transcriptional regulator n=1 Tax=Amycolatopsis sp. TaxID=37632 RepID=UPI002B487CF6|nr:TetR/AcrR family transcriptional regulator [Amycolatopsis sp.]HKS49048.1 TetR/AcrR family transcriptional regulator [Amycolatopsis sp.]